jgi:hypothetical protein
MRCNHPGRGYKSRLAYTILQYAMSDPWDANHLSPGQAPRVRKV